MLGEKEHVTKDGRKFTFVENKPYRRKDGADSQIMVWASGCVQCGARFTVTTPIGFANTKAFALVHCAMHRLNPAQTSARGMAVIKANREKRQGQGLLKTKVLAHAAANPADKPRRIAAALGLTPTQVGNAIYKNRHALNKSEKGTTA